MNARLRAHGRRQHGLFTYTQAIEANVGKDMLARNLRSHRWEEVEPDVYRALPAAALSFEQRAHAMALSAGGVAYGRTAVALYDLGARPAAVEVLVDRPLRNRDRPGLHSTRSLPASDVTTVARIPTTMPCRSIIDAAATLTPDTCCQLVDAAVVRRLVRPESLARRANELLNSRRPGASRVLAALAEQHPLLDRARNEREAQVLRLCREHGLPDPVPNHVVVVGGARRMLDTAWPDCMVDLEFDGFGPHTVRRTFDDDRARQNLLVAEGWLVFRTTARLLERDPRGVFEPIGHAIRARGRRPEAA